MKKDIVTSEGIPYSTDFMKRINQLKQDMYNFASMIGEEATPPFDANGRAIISKRLDGKDYITEAYMRKKLGLYFPGWSLEEAAPLHFLGAEWVVAQVSLIIIDEHLIGFGIVPPVRKFYGVDSVRIQYKHDAPHTPDNIIDVGDNCKQAVSAALKYAINRLTNIGDDVYGKRMDLEGAGTLDEILSNSNTSDSTSQQMFTEYCKRKKLRPSEVFKILAINDMTEITDYKTAYQQIKTYAEKK